MENDRTPQMTRTDLSIETAIDEPTWDWQTPPRQWDELLQVTDDYVVGARGYCIGTDVWLDEYAVFGGHSGLWNRQMVDAYEIDSWDATEELDWFDAQFADTMYYWSVTGGQNVVVRYPRLAQTTDRQVAMLGYFFRDGLGAPGDAALVWSIDDRDETITTGTSLAELYEELP